MPRNTETVESLFERQRGTLPDTFGLRPLSVTGAPIPAGIGLARSAVPVRLASARRAIQAVAAGRGRMAVIQKAQQWRAFAWRLGGTPVIFQSHNRGALD